MGLGVVRCGDATYDGLDLRNFYETRDGELSVDRLGRSSVENPVVTYLLPRAHAAGAKFAKPKSFGGWFVIVVRNIEKPPDGNKFNLKVVASAIEGEALEENLYHAHIPIPREENHHLMALYLRHLFARYGHAFPVGEKASGSDAMPAASDSYGLWRWVCSIASRVWGGGPSR